MGCRTGWDRVLLTSNFSNVFVTKHLKNHREDILLDREKSLLPSSQGYVDRYLHEKEMMKIKNEMREEIKKISNTLDELEVKRKDARLSCKYTMFRQLSDECKKLFFLRNAHIKTVRDINRTSSTCEVYGVGKVRTKCPLDNCRGYLCNSSTCGVCEKNVCTKCMEELVENHKCNPDTVKTLKAIMKESRACPGCGTMVSKIDGCDQMWCTVPTCHTAFNWRTGKQVNGHIHNPHYVQFQNENVVGGMNRNVRDIPCGGMPEYREVVIALAGLRMLPKYMPTSLNTSVKNHMIGGVHMATNHIVDELTRFQIGPPDNGILRAKYLLKEIQECDLKKTLQMYEKKREKNKSFCDILTMFTHTMSDIFRNLIHIYNQFREKWVICFDRKEEEGFDYSKEIKLILIASQVRVMTEFKNIEKLTEYTIKHLRKTSVVYKCVIPKSTLTVLDYGPTGFTRINREMFHFDVALQKAFIGISNESRYTLIYGENT
tara:strand:+ start:12367 stop:13830 length:1464 start_codon:yes stop_codon:yes gene_type:complete